MELWCKNNTWIHTILFFFLTSAVERAANTSLNTNGRAQASFPPDTSQFYAMDCTSSPSY